jgi:hypothetical protein
MFTITDNNWNGFVPISFVPGMGGEFFAHLMHYRHEPFDPANFPFNKAGKFSYVNEEKPLKWNSDKNLLGWYMKSPYVNTVADHDLLVKKLGLGDKFIDSFDHIVDFNKLSFAIANFCVEKGGSKHMDVNSDEFINYIKNFDYSRKLTFEEYRFGVVHPFFRWFNKQEERFDVFPNAKAIQLVCAPQYGWLFYFMSFVKMYKYYLAYVEAGETFRKKFFDNLENNFIGRIEKKYAVGFCSPIKREHNPNFNVDSFEWFFNCNPDDSIAEYLGEDFKIDRQALHFYRDLNIKIFNFYDLDPYQHFVPGKVIFDRFQKYGPFEHDK